MSVAGFQAIGDTGSYQVDSNFKNLAMVRSGTLISQTYTNGETTNTSPSRATLTLNDGEILALSCSVFCALGSRVGNTAYVYCSEAAGQLIRYYVFKPGDNPTGFGLQVFDASGDLTFDAGWKLFDVRSILSGYSSAQLPSGRSYAFVHSQIGTRITYNKVVNGMEPNIFTSYIRSTEFSSYAISGSTISCALSAVDIASTRPSRGSSGPGFTRIATNNVNPVALVIDVTGY